MDTDKQKGGYFKIWRSFLWGDLWKQMPFSHGKLWLWLLAEAAHKGNAAERQLEPGQLDHSIRFMCEALRWYDTARHKSLTPSPPTILKALDRLKTDECITVETVGGVKTVITICNWESYQSETEGGYNTENNTVNNTANNELKNVQEVQELEHPPNPTDSGVPLKKKKKTKAQRINEKIDKSPHGEFIREMADWFYKLEHTTNPTPGELLDALEVCELVLRKDFKDDPDPGKRLKRIVVFAIRDEGEGGEFGWKMNLLSLAQLRAKKAGVMKWKKIENSLLRGQASVDPGSGIGGVRLPTAEEIRIEGNKARIREREKREKDERK